MSRFALAALAVAILAASPAFAQPAPPLAGANTVYLNVDDLSVRRDIARALKAELPQVKVVWKLSEADVVLGFRGSVGHDTPAGSTTVSTDRALESNSSGYARYETTTKTVPLGQPMHNPGGMQGIVVRGNTVIAVLHEGLWTPAFPNQFAARFIRAWREANP